MSENSTFFPHIVCSNAAAAIDFYKTAFGATELARHVAPNSSKIMHASLSINGGTLMLNDDFCTEMGKKSETPEALGGCPVVLHMQVKDADAHWAKATAAGATVVFPLADQFWGDRYGVVQDPFGYRWSIGQSIRKLNEEELEVAAKEAFAH